MLKKFFSDDDLRAFMKVAIVVFSCAVLFGLWMFSKLFWFEVQPVHHGWDGLIYTAVGRGIVNGLVPYKDLFEFKPPGIFLISAGSLWLFDDIRLGNLLQGLCYVAIMGLLLFGPVSEIRRRRWKLQMKDALPLLGCLLFGMMSVFYLAAKAGQFQTESFASVFAIAFLVAIGQKMTRTKLLLAALFLMLAVGMKESFLAIIFAATLVLFPLQRKYRDLVSALFFAVLLGLGLLFLLGYLGPYLTIYLPETLIGRASFNPYPIWVLAFDTSFALRDIWTFSPHFLVALGVLWTTSLITMADGWSRSRVLAALCLLTASFIALYHYGSSIIMLAQSGQHSFDQTPLPTDPLLLPVLFSALAYVLCAWIALSFFFEKKDAMRIFSTFLQHIAAVILTVMAILVGGMLQQQFGSFIPLFAALILSSIHEFSSEKITFSLHSFFFLLATVIASFGLIFLVPVDHNALLAEQRQSQKVSMKQALEIDSLMDACGYDRYLIFGEPHVPYAYTIHSPYGPAFTRTSFTFPVKWRKPPIPYLQDAYRENLKAAKFVIARRVEVEGTTKIDSTDVPDDVWQMFVRDFSVNAPSCAAPFHSSGDMMFLFRAH